MTTYIAIAFGKNKEYGVVLPYSDFRKAAMLNILSKAGDGILDILYCGIDQDKANSAIRELDVDGEDLTARLQDVLSRK
jgi:hypothetical protein